jgi:hypothetical protein
LSHPPSVTHSPNPQTNAERGRARPRFRPLLVTSLLLVLAVGLLLFQPNCFRFATRQALLFEAWRNGVHAQISEVEGSLFEPLKLRDSVWIYESEGGPVTRIEIQTAVAEFSWSSLFSRNSEKWFRRLTIEGVSGKIQLPLDSRAPSSEGFRLSLPEFATKRWMPAPERIEARAVDFVFQSNGDYVRLAQTQFTLSDLEAGSIQAGQILIHQPWLTRTFREVRGTTKLDGATIDIANLTLEPGVDVRDISVDLDNLARGILNLEMELSAFGGEIRIEAETLSQTRVFGMDATGTFSQISIAKLATFLGVSEAAGGAIKEGKFTFRGPPQHLAQATASLHFEATNFQWESRQWDSLVAGATLMDGRVQIPGLALTQGHNQLNLNGEMALPVPGLSWWQTEFNLNIAAKIDNLTELSALLLPEFKFAAGKANIDGSIRGNNQQFNGQIIVSGSELQWHNAPIDELHASVKLNGNEFQITNLSIFNDGDFVRGRGVVNILGDKQYWGEVHASIMDLAKYSAILQKPLVPEPLAGGARVEWSGEGSAKGHSGKFLARLQKLRSMGATAALLHPINADLEGTYAAGGMTFSQFSLSDDESSFTANVAIGSKILSLQQIRLSNKQAVWLEGDALLPFDIWNAWPNTSFATLLDDHTACRVNLTAHDLHLRDASLLSGWKFPIEGLVNGQLSADGTIGALKTAGRLSLHQARIPLGGGDALTDVEAEATLDGHILHLMKFAGRYPAGDFAAAGDVDFSNLRDPNLRLTLTSQASVIGLFSEVRGEPSIFLPATATMTLQLNLTGPMSAGKVGGEAQVSLLKFGGTLDLGFYLTPQVSDTAPRDDGEWPLPFGMPSNPWTAWTLDIHCQTAPNARVAGNWSPQNSGAPSATPPSASAAMDLRLEGAVSDPVLAGSLRVQDLPAHSGVEDVVIENGVWSFRPDAPRAPSTTLRIGGNALGEAYTAEMTSVGGQRLLYFEGGLALNERLIQGALSGENRRSWFNGDDVLELEVPSIWRDAANSYLWPAIPEPGVDATAPAPPGPASASPPAPAPGTAPASSPAPVPAPAPVPPSTPGAAATPPPAAANPPASSPAPPAPPATPAATPVPASAPPAAPAPPKGGTK